MNKETAFNSEVPAQINIPESFIAEHLQKINDPELFKLLLYIFWRFSKSKSEIKYIGLNNIQTDETFCENFGNNREIIDSRLQNLLTEAVEVGVLLICSNPDKADIDLYFYNSTKNQKIVRSIESGEIKLEDILDISLAVSKPNIFKLYEENIGPLTPLIAETLEDAAASYSIQWIEEAMQIAVENNVRRWKYVQAILERWQEEGKNARRDQKDTQEDREKYLKGKYSDLIKR